MKERKKKKKKNWFIYIVDVSVVLSYVQQKLKYFVCEVNINVKPF